MRLFEMENLRHGICNTIRNWKAHYIRHWTPCYALNRIKLLLYELRHSDHPWLTQQANSILSTLLKPKDVGFEWGSGRSTLWFAKRVKHLTSVEHDDRWYKMVSGKLRSANLVNVNFLLKKIKGYKKPMDSPYVQVINKFRKNSLDFVIVDGIYRDLCANLALDKIRPGRVIVLDNANRFIPSDSISPKSIPKDAAPVSNDWGRFLNRIKNWHQIWTSNGVFDTAIWFKPS
jgi:hypothetical protein